MTDRPDPYDQDFGESYQTDDTGPMRVAVFAFAALCVVAVVVGIAWG